jgi:hypothetical protein
MMSNEQLVGLCRNWEAIARKTDGRMRDLIGSRWYSTMPDEERKQYCVLQAEYTAYRSCANDLARLLGIETQS